MSKIVVLLVLLLAYAVYSAAIYTEGTKTNIELPLSQLKQVDEGKIIYQEYNCAACHQIYGLGGYLGPELTTAYSDKHRGENYMRALLQSGGSRMPNFHFSSHQIEALIAYLKYVDTTATPVKSIYPN